MPVRTLVGLVALLAATSSAPGQNTRAARPPVAGAKDPPLKTGSVETLPRKAVVGAEFVYQLSVAGMPKATFAKQGGPDELTVSEGGLLRWTPPPEYADKTPPVVVTVKTDKPATVAFMIAVQKAGAAAGENKAEAPPPPSAAAAALDKEPLFDLTKGAGLPAYLRADAGMLGDADGLRDGEARTRATDLGDKDFVFDVLFRFRDGERSIALIGLTGTAPGVRASDESVGSRGHGPGHGGYATLTVTGKAETRLGAFKTAGPHLYRLEKKGDALTLSVGGWKDGAFRPYFAQTVGPLKTAAPFLGKPVASPYFGGGADFLGVRMSVGGKVVDPGRPAPPPADVSKVPLTPLGGGRPLPPFLTTVAGGVADRDGLRLEKAFYRTAGGGLIDKDFVLDLRFRFRDGEQGIIVAGLGDASQKFDSLDLKDSVCSRVHGPGHGGYGTVTVAGQPERRLGDFKTAGPHLFRLRKKGNVLTMAVCVGFKDTFTPDIEQSIPDLKAVAPFLTGTNSGLFVGGGGVAEAVRLVVDGEAVESRDLALDLPKRVVEGRPLRQPLLPAAAGRRLALAAGPKGMTVSPAGEVTWTPAAGQLGRHEVRVRVTTGKETAVAVLAVEVVSAEDAKSAGGDLARVDGLYRLPLASDRSFVTPGLGGRSLLLLEGDRLRRLTGTGVTVKDDLKLPARYERVAERADSFVALSDEKKALHVIDKKTLAVRRSVPMDYPARTDLAPHPTKPLSYVCVEAGGDGPPYRILAVEEDTGDVREPAGFFGTWAAVSPDGRTLYAGYRELYQKGNRLLINPDRIHVVPEYGTFDALIVYDITGPKPVRRAFKEEPGGNGTGLVLSADGKRLSYLSHAGYPVYSGGVPAWSPADLDKRPVSYPAKDQGGPPTWVAFHPVLEVAATPAKGGAVCYHRETGAARPELADLRYPPLGEAKVERVYFAPDGQHLLLACEADGGRFLRRVRLNLTPAEAAKVKAARLE